MKTLFISPTPPWPPNIGVALRLHSLLTAFEQLGDVDCVFFGHPEEIFNTPFATRHRIIDVLPRPDFADHPLLRLLMQRVAPLERDWWVTYLPGIRSFYLARPDIRHRFHRLNPEAYDLIFLCRIKTAWWLGWKDPLRTMIDLDDVHFLGALENASMESDFFRKLVKTWRYKNLRRAELKTLDYVAAALVCSLDDANRLDHPKVHVVPNVFPDHGQLFRPFTARDSKTILFVGDLVYKSNREGLQYFIKKVLPLIHKEDSDVELQIIGRTVNGQSFPWANRPGVELLGTVDDVVPYIERAAIEVCPMLSGGGTRIKILESLSFGKPVVSTTIGAYGHHLSENAGLFRADSPEGMADLCLKLLGDLEWRKALGEQARRAVARDYSQEKVNEIIRNIVLGILEK